MSTAQSFQPGHAANSGQSNGVTLNLSSNNPFRNRAPSPANLDSPPFINKPASPFDDPPARPLSRNPFIDQAPPPLRSSGVMSTQSDSKSLSAEEIFNSLTLDDKASSDRPKPPPGPRRPMERPPPRRPGDNAQPPSDGSHRPTRSQEDAIRARRMQAPSGARPTPNSPQRKPPRRPRRNSESSVLDFDAQPLTEEEKRMIEAKRRERERPRRGDGKDKSKPTRPSRRMDIIDQLDATSIYGTGVFHHDGPFDALNPHRNRGSSRRAPMQAFPKDSLNNSLGGAGPLNNSADHSAFMGNATDEAFRDFSKGGKSGPGYYPPSRTDPPIFDPISRGSIIHGEETHGLGTSTFLEGTPAARSAIVRRQAEQAQENMEGGLQRKKSLAQRIRHINKGPRDYSATRSNGEGGYTRITPDGMASAASTGSDNNPFFSEFNKGEELISVKGRDSAKSPPNPPTASRRRPSAGLVLERRATTGASSSLDDGAAPKPTGLLGRMKSLKGGRRARPDGSNAPPAPGTAV